MSKIEKGIESSMVCLQIKELMEKARKQVSVQINNILVQTYWEVGKIIIEDEQKNKERAEYEKKLLKELSKKLTKEHEKGFSKSNLFNMRKFYLKYQKFHTVSGYLENGKVWEAFFKKNEKIYLNTEISVSFEINEIL